MNAHHLASTSQALESYCRYAYRKSILVFCDDVERAECVAERFSAAGVAAEAISGETPDVVRRQIVKRFATGETLAICGTTASLQHMDLVAEAVAILSPTKSAAVFAAQLRPLRGGSGDVFDLVGNGERLGLPENFNATYLAIKPARPLL